MSVGDSVSDLQSLASDGTLDIQPAVGAEYLIHTIFSGQGKALEVYVAGAGSPTLYALVDSLSGGSAHSLTLRVTNSTYLRLKNVSGGTAYVGYMGVVTK